MTPEGPNQETTGIGLTVIVPANNAASTIANQLEALRTQTVAAHFEVLVVDDASTDSTAQVVGAFAAVDERIRLIRLPTNAGSYAARNAGAAQAAGDLLVFCDADDVVQDGFLAALLAAAIKAEIIGSAVVLLGDANPDYMAPREELPRLMGFLPVAFTAGLAVRRTAFESLGRMDPTLQSGGDADFCWRAQLAGYRLQFAPAARVQYRLRSTCHARFRQSYRYGLAQPLLFRRFRAHGLTRRGWNKVLRDWAKLVITVPIGPWVRPTDRLAWCSGVGLAIGHVVGSFRYGTLWL